MTSEATQRKTRLQKYIVEEAQARERLSNFPEAVRQRLTKWQESQSEWFGCTVLEIVAEFITFDDAAQSGEGRGGAGEGTLREALELAKIKLRRYMDVHGPNGLNPDTYVGGYQAKIEAVLTTIDAALRATDDAGGAAKAPDTGEGE